MTVARGGEIRAWDLEGDVRLAEPERKSDYGANGIMIRSQAELANTEHVPKALSRYLNAQRSEPDNAAVARSLVGFNDGQIVVIAEKGAEALALVSHDFT